MKWFITCTVLGIVWLVLRVLDTGTILAVLPVSIVMVIDTLAGVSLLFWMAMMIHSNLGIAPICVIGLVFISPILLLAKVIKMIEKRMMVKRLVDAGLSREDAEELVS